MIKCEKCNGTGFVPLGPGLRGIKKCHVCNGTGEVKDNPEKTRPTIRELNTFSVGGNVLHPEEGCYLTLYDEDDQGNTSDIIVFHLTPKRVKSLAGMLRDYTEEKGENI